MMIVSAALAARAPCVSSNGVDFSGIGGMYSQIPSQINPNTTYTFSPCFGFICNTDTGAALCRDSVVSGIPFATPIGDVDGTRITRNPGSNAGYTFAFGVTPDTPEGAKMVLTCDKTLKFHFTALDDSQPEVVIYATSTLACAPVTTTCVVKGPSGKSTDLSSLNVNPFNRARDFTGYPFAFNVCSNIVGGCGSQSQDSVVCASNQLNLGLLSSQTITLVTNPPAIIFGYTSPTGSAKIAILCDKRANGAPQWNATYDSQSRSVTIVGATSKACVW